MGITLSNFFDFARKLPRCLHMLRAKRWGFGNIMGHASGVSDVSSLMSWTASQFDLTLCWDDVEWLKSIWDRKLILKGINDPEDAVTAAKLGADAIVVSNHGGRQLDGTHSSIE